MLRYTRRMGTVQKIFRAALFEGEVQRIGYPGHENRDCENKKEDSDMIKTTMKIEGMMCGMCESHVCGAIRKAVPAAQKVSASRHKKEASFLTEEAVDPGSLKSAIDATGYTCLSVESARYEKKGLFGRK